MINKQRDYYKEKKKRIENNLILVGCVKCKKCSFWIGKEFVDEKGSCKGGCNYKSNILDDKNE